MKKYKQINPTNQAGFTIVELLLVFIIIAVLSIMSVMSYMGLQYRAEDISRVSDIKNVSIRLENYAAEHDGKYPATTDNPIANWRTVDVRTDDNCFNGTSQADWVPSFGDLPQSKPNVGMTAGVDGPGCYLYASNGVEYVLSAWNMVATPQTTQLYHRQGFRTFQTPTSTQFYTCNDNVTGGIIQGKYDITKDYYKHSYTITNINSCDEST